MSGVNPAKGRIDFADSERHGKITRGNWFWIEGVKEELDQPGEWYLDRKEETLYYMPRPGGSQHRDDCRTTAERDCDAKGEVEKKTHVEYVNFSGLEFRHSIQETQARLGHRGLAGTKCVTDDFAVLAIDDHGDVNNLAVPT